MKLILYLVILSVVAIILMDISNNFVAERGLSARTAMTDSETAIIENLMARVKYAVDLVGNGNPILNTCPAGSVIKNLKNQPKLKMCWPSNNKMCETTTKLIACVVPAQSLASTSPIFQWKRPLFVFYSSSAMAAPVTPGKIAAAGTGFFISGPTPVRCTDTTCASVVISICKNDSGVCSGTTKYLTQTIAFNN